MSGDAGRQMTQWPKERWAHPGWWGLLMGFAAASCGVVGAVMDANTPGDFPNPLVLLAFLGAILFGVIMLFCLGIYVIGSVIFSTRRASRVDDDEVWRG